MRIAIEAVNANKPPEHGSETYLYNVIRSLLDLDWEDTYYLYTDCPVDARSRFERANVVYRHVQEVKYLYGLGKRTLFDDPWSEFFVALDLLLFTRPDIYVFNAGSHLPFTRPYHTICHVHDLSEFAIPECYSNMEKANFAMTKPRALRSASRVAALSARTKNDTIRFVGIPEEKITVIYPGYDAGVFNTEFDEGRFQKMLVTLKLPGRYIITTGMIHPKKNLVRLVQAFQSIKAVGKFEGSLVITGPDKYQGEEIRREIGRVAPDGGVVFAGSLPVGDMAELLKGAELFVFPALYEGFGLSLLEAMACGIPSVASRTGALPEVAGGNSLLVDPYNVEEMGRAMVEALHNIGLRDRLRTGGLRRAKEFSWDKTARQYLELFKELGARKRLFG